MTKQPDGCRPAACTSNPAARAKLAELRQAPVPPSHQDHHQQGRRRTAVLVGRYPAEDDDATCGTRRLGAAPQDGHRRAIGPVAQHVFQQREIGPGWQRSKKLWPTAVTRSATPAT